MESMQKEKRTRMFTTVSDHRQFQLKRPIYLKSTALVIRIVGFVGLVPFWSQCKIEPSVA